MVTDFSTVSVSSTYQLLAAPASARIFRQGPAQGAQDRCECKADPGPVTSVKVLEKRVSGEVVIGQAARSGSLAGSA